LLLLLQASALEHRHRCASAAATELQARLSDCRYSPIPIPNPFLLRRTRASNRRCLRVSDACGSICCRFATVRLALQAASVAASADRTAIGLRACTADEALRAADDETLPVALRAALLCSAARLHELQAAEAVEAPPQPTQHADHSGARSACAALSADAVATMRVSDLKEWLDKLGVPIGAVLYCSFGCSLFAFTAQR
jgi:hypothetical protein